MCGKEGTSILKLKLPLWLFVLSNSPSSLVIFNSKNDYLLAFSLTLSSVFVADRGLRMLSDKRLRVEPFPTKWPYNMCILFKILFRDRNSIESLVSMQRRHFVSSLIFTSLLVLAFLPGFLSP